MPVPVTATQNNIQTFWIRLQKAKLIFQIKTETKISRKIAFKCFAFDVVNRDVDIFQRRIYDTIYLVMILQQKGAQRRRVTTERLTTFDWLEMKYLLTVYLIYAATL